MTVREFIKCLDRKKIPSFPPAVQETTMENACARLEANARGMWTPVYKSWVCQLANWLEGRKVLEVMAGHGWLAKTLAEAGVEIIATDDYSWFDAYSSKASLVFNVMPYDALEAIGTFGPSCKVLIMSSPPCNDEIVTRCAKAWDSQLLVYIGEGRGGCHAPSSFWRGWVENPQAPKIPLFTWPGSHETILIGSYKRDLI